MKKRVQGSFTIEAVLIIPIVMFIILTIIYISIYLHDYNRMYSITDRVLHKAIFNTKHESDFETGKLYYEDIKGQGIFYQVLGISDTKEDDIEEYLMNKLTEGLFATSITDVDVDGNKLKTTIKVQGEFQIPLRGISEMFSPNKNLMVEVSAQNHNPAEAVRISEVLLDTGSKIKGVNEIKEKIKKLIP